MPIVSPSASLKACLQLEAANRDAKRAAARVGSPRERSPFPHERRDALATRKIFRDCVAILEAALV